MAAASAALTGHGALTATARATKFVFSASLSGHGALHAAATGYFGMGSKATALLPQEARIRYLRNIQRPS